MGGWAELGKAALDILGKAAPWVIIACLAAFGIYKLQDLNQNNLQAVQQIAEKERAQAREDFSVANKALKDTYEAANKLYTEMIGSVGSSLKQLQTLEGEVREKQKAVFQSQIEAEQTKASLALQQNSLTTTRKQLDELHAQAQSERAAADAAKKEAMDAAAARDHAETAAKLLSSRLSRENEELIRTSLQLEDTKRQIGDKREELRQAIARLKDVSGLVNELARLPDSPRKEEIDELRRKARAVVPGVEEFLRLYRDQPLARSNLDVSSLVGIRMSELKLAINSSNGYHWFLAHTNVRDRNDTRIVAIPDDQRGKFIITSSIVFKLSDLPPEKERLFSDRPSSVLEENLTISNAYLSSAVVFRCVDPRNFSTVLTMQLSSDSASTSSTARAVGDQVSLLEVVGRVYLFAGNAYQVRGQAWSQKVHSPAEVLRTLPDFVKSQTIKNPLFGPTLCLRFAANLDALSKIDIRVIGLTEEENGLVNRELSSLYRAIFHSKQQFLDMPELPAEHDKANIGQIGTFVSGIAQVALSHHSSFPNISRNVLVAASRTDGRIRLQIDPGSTPELLNRLEPLYVELAENRVRIVTGLVATK
jgi:hypothetical protein